MRRLRGSSADRFGRGRWHGREVSHQAAFTRHLRARTTRRTRRRLGPLAALCVIAATLGTPSTTAGAATAPNGLIAYAAWDADQSGHDVWLMDPASPELAPRRLTKDGRYNNNPDWSPDGTRIAYNGYANFGSPRIWSMDDDPATDDWTQLSKPACNPVDGCFWDFQPAWSPDGQKMAFASNRSPDGWGMGGYELFMMDASGETAESPAIQLTDTRTGDNWKPTDWFASWSPDSTRLVFASSRGEGRFYDSCDLWVMDAVDANGDGEGDNMRRITFDGGPEQPFSIDCGLLQPAWSPVPGSSLVTFASTRAGSHFDIWIVDVDNPADMRNVTQSSDSDDTPSWSPDGTQIVYRSTRSGAYELWSLPVPPPASAEPSLAMRVMSGSGSSVAAATPVPTRLTTNGGAENSPRDEQAADWGARSGGAGSVLTVRKTGTGGGRVSSSPGGITCGTDCTEPYEVGTEVTLTATPNSSSRFVGWRHACGGATTPTCSVTMKDARTVTARFNKTALLTVERVGSGSGRVTSSPAGIACGTDCTEAYDVGTEVTLAAAPRSGSVFTGWTGACAGTTSTCVVSVSAAKTVTATFDRTG